MSYTERIYPPALTVRYASTHCKDSLCMTIKGGVDAAMSGLKGVMKKLYIHCYVSKG